MEKAENDGLAPEKLGLNEDGVYDSADYRLVYRLWEFFNILHGTVPITKNLEVWFGFASSFK